jgi:hypothetical protein
MTDEEILGYVLKFISVTLFATSPFIAFGFYDKYLKSTDQRKNLSNL